MEARALDRETTEDSDGDSWTGNERPEPGGGDGLSCVASVHTARTFGPAPARTAALDLPEGDEEQQDDGGRDTGKRSNHLWRLDVRTAVAVFLFPWGQTCKTSV
jgi:hypothetical protein